MGAITHAFLAIFKDFFKLIRYFKKKDLESFQDVVVLLTGPARNFNSVLRLKSKIFF